MGQDKPKILPFPKKGIAQTPGSACIIDVSASSGSRPQPLAGEALRQAVTRIVLYGTFRESAHSAFERSYRNVSERDILAMLEGEWTVAAEPEWDDRHRNWKHKLTGKDLDGDELTLLIAVNVELNHIDIITKF